jgi:hypothetical protein
MEKKIVLNVNFKKLKLNFIIFIYFLPVLNFSIISKINAAFGKVSITTSVKVLGLVLKQITNGLYKMFNINSERMKTDHIK